MLSIAVVSASTSHGKSEPRYAGAMRTSYGEEESISIKGNEFPTVCDVRRMSALVSNPWRG